MFLVLGILAIMTAIGTVILGMNGKKAAVLRFSIPSRKSPVKMSGDFLFL